MMAQKICENIGFMDITDIYASDICLVEHSYGYGENSTEYILSDTQVVSLEGRIDEGDLDTDRDEVFDRDEMGVEEEVNISRLLEAYIKYNGLDQEEADKLRATPTVKMYNYISNPVLPDSDFDGRSDLRDRARALNNSYEMAMDTDVVDRSNYDLNVDYRYFFMDNTKYYPELSDMAVTIANMVTKKGWQNKNWTNKTEGLNGSDIESFMWHYGNEDIEVHDMSSYYSDANVCRYAMGQHDVFLRRGKVNHKVRNVITVAIGEIPEKTAELTANLYGLLGDDEEHSEYHHIGYDITASRILENVLRFADTYSGNQKVFFITGARSAGGVANLLAKKLIDKFGPSSVYGYTFNAVATINGNMIPEGSKLPNLQYAPIMNIYNDDEMMVMFTSEETNMYKYGTNVHMSLSENLTSKVKAAFKKVHGSNYDKNMKSKVVDLLNRIFNINLRGYSAFVFGMTGTLDLNNVFSGETDDDKQSLLNHWKPLYEKTKNEDYNEYVKIIDLRLSGIKLDSFEDYVAYLMGLNTFGANGETPTNNPPGNNATSGTIIYDRELIKTIVSAAEFYINHIPTYKGKLKTRVDKGNISYDENDLAIKHLTDNLTEYTSADTTTIEYTNDKKIKLIKTLDNNNKITGAKREFNMINESDGKKMYFDSNFSLGHYKWKDIINNGNSYNVNNNFTGWDWTKDDCSGSIQFIINIRESEDKAIFSDDMTTGDLMNWQGWNAKQLYKKGWVCYYRNNEGIWSECSGTTIDKTIDKTNEIKTKGVKFLQPGDLLLCAGKIVA